MEQERQTTPSNDWRAATVEFLSARFALVCLESHEAKKVIAVKGISLWLCIASAVFTWITACFATLGFITQHYHIAWWKVLFCISLFHLIISCVSLVFFRKKSAPIFPVTRSEFQKDQEWLQATNKSKH